MANEKINVKDVYDIKHYSWDGKSRPVLENYTNPWLAYSSQGSPSNMFYKKRYGAITYAQNQLKTAIDQYNSDLDFWNEADSRSYNSPISQTSRFEDAGYNLGYLYNQVDSGNTSSGYNGAFSDMEPNETTNMDNPIETAMSVISTVSSTLVGLLDSGVKAYEIIKLTPQKFENLFHDSSLKSIQASWANFLQSYGVDEAGDIIPLRSDQGGFTAHYGDNGLSFQLSQFITDLSGSKMSNNDLSTWLKYCDKIYSASAAEDDTFIKDANEWVDGQDWKPFLKLLAKFMFNLSNSAKASVGVSVRPNKK